MTNTTRLAAFILLIALSAAAYGDAAVRREAFGAAKASVLTSIIPVIYPGKTVVWHPDLALRAADGTETPLRVPDAIEREDANGFTFVFAIEVGEKEEAIAEVLQNFQPATETSITEIVTVKTDRSLAILGHRRGKLPETAVITEVEELRFPLDSDGGALEWPHVYILYSATYGTTGVFGQINWEGKISTEPLAFLHRLPVGLLQMSRGSDLIMDTPYIFVGQDAQSFRIYSHVRRATMMRCAVPCVPDGLHVLALWAPKSAVAVAP